MLALYVLIASFLTIVSGQWVPPSPPKPIECGGAKTKYQDVCCGQSETKSIGFKACPSMCSTVQIWEIMVRDSDSPWDTLRTNWGVNSEILVTRDLSSDTTPNGWSHLEMIMLRETDAYWAGCSFQAYAMQAACDSDTSKIDDFAYELLMRVANKTTVKAESLICPGWVDKINQAFGDAAADNWISMLQSMGGSNWNIAIISERVYTCGEMETQFNWFFTYFSPYCKALNRQQQERHNIDFTKFGYNTVVTGSGSPVPYFSQCSE